MATFKIFEDRDENREKENRVIGNGLTKHLVNKGQEKRPTLAVLNNVVDQKRGVSNGENKAVRYTTSPFLLYFYVYYLRIYT